ncbi:hypothetical protein F5Y07DRAFT_158812 [Xylaria sp. FL0933]|nr:hypothetical protein F5Y07DRAFT_158812 [Xylaria sp. FL0933]
MYSKYLPRCRTSRLQAAKQTQALFRQRLCPSVASGSSSFLAPGPGYLLGEPNFKTCDGWAGLRPKLGGGPKLQLPPSYFLPPALRLCPISWCRLAYRVRWLPWLSWRSLHLPSSLLVYLHCRFRQSTFSLRTRNTKLQPASIRQYTTQESYTFGAPCIKSDGFIEIDRSQAHPHSLLPPLCCHCMPLHAVPCYSPISSISIIHSRQTSPQNKQTLKTTTTCCESLATTTASGARNFSRQTLIESSFTLSSDKLGLSVHYPAGSSLSGSSLLIAKHDSPTPTLLLVSHFRLSN